MDLKGGLSSIKRVRFFTGQLISADDLEVEQQYLREKLKRHNRYLHGSGVVFGLEVSIEEQRVRVAPGFALDCTGEEIAVSVPEMIDPPEESRFAFLMISYHELTSEPVPAMGSGADDTMLPSRIEETFKLSYESDNPYIGHTGDTALWMPCNQRHPMPIAKLVRRWDTWEVDPWFEPPSITR